MRHVRWQVVSATLSMSLGVILFAMNCIHLHDAMIPEIRRTFDPATGFPIYHGLFCLVASVLWTGAASCAIAAAQCWMSQRYVRATSLMVLGVPATLLAGVFLFRFQ
jgi:hypothetical protein